MSGASSRTQACFWGEGIKYDGGCHPSVSIDPDGNIVELHKSPDFNIIHYYMSVGTSEE
jgi:hypothetical protein